MLVIIEGLSFVGKTSIAKMFEKRGYKYIHFKKPQDKYYTKDYIGPSYQEAIVDLYTNIFQKHKDVVFDRSPLSELIYPQYFERKSLLTLEDYEAILELEKSYDARKIYLIEENEDEHFIQMKSAISNLSKSSYKSLKKEYMDMAKKYGYEIKTAKQIKEEFEGKTNIKKQPEIKKTATVQLEIPNISQNLSIEDVNKKLEKANAINKILSKRIIKYQGEIFDNIETSVREFLTKEIKTLFQSDTDESLSNKELSVLKMMANRVLEKTNKE